MISPTSTADPSLLSRKCYGYARSSSDKQEESTGDQQTRIMAIVPLVPGQFVHARVDDGVSAKFVPFFERPAFRKLMAEIRHEDALIIWRWDRLERRASHHLALRDWLVQRRIVVYQTIDGGKPMDLASMTGKLVTGVMAVFAEGENDARGEASKTKKDLLKTKGLRYHGQTKFGYHRTFASTLSNGRHRDCRWHRNDQERTIIREIVRRRMFRQTARQIAADLTARGIRTAEKHTWKPGRVSKAAVWYVRTVLSGELPWGGDEDEAMAEYVRASITNPWVATVALPESD